jgi:hypothetical protein
VVLQAGPLTRSLQVESRPRQADTYTREFRAIGVERATGF